MNQRSDQQNRFYWGAVISTAAECFGIDADSAHEQLKLAFLGLAVDPITGEELNIARSTTALSVGEFADYLNQIIGLLEDRGYHVPSPAEYEGSAA